MRPAFPYQRGLHGFNGLLFVPNGVDGTGGGLGGPWTVNPIGNVVTHPAPTQATLASQLQTSMCANDAVANREIGPRRTDARFQFGTAVGRGGFWCSWIFRIEAWNNNAARLFVGLASAASGSIVTLSDAGATPTVAGAGITGTNCIGVYHDATDGAGVLSILSAAGAAGGKAAIAGSTLAAANAFQFELWCQPGTGATYRWRLSAIGSTATTLIAFGTSGGPGVLLAPQCQMSNVADAVAGHFAIGLANFYGESGIVT